MHFGMRIEHSIAIIAQMLANRYRKENSAPFSLYDFAPHHDEPEMSMDDLKGWK